MSIPHLKQRAEFYALCLEHGEENVEWRHRFMKEDWSRWIPAECSHILHPNWGHQWDFEFRVRPRTVVIPKAAVPEEDPEGKCCIYIRTGHANNAEEFLLKRFCYRTAEDRDAVVAAMLAREVR